MVSKSGTELPPGNVAVLRSGQTARICIEYGGRARSLLWIATGKDGSLYTNYCLDGPAVGSRLIPEVSPDGGVRFSWTNGEPLSDPTRPKISFHASGIIYSPSGKSIGVRLRQLTQRSLVCAFLPRHPSQWRELQTHRSRDIVLRNLIQDECPLAVELYYQPAGARSSIAANLQVGRFVVPIGFTDVEAHNRVLVHLVFRRLASARLWPTKSVIAWPHIGSHLEPVGGEYWFEPG